MVRPWMGSHIQMMQADVHKDAAPHMLDDRTTEDWLGVQSDSSPCVTARAATILQSSI